jgi:hypothetical protein
MGIHAWQCWAQGQEKMSKSDPNSAIFMEDEAADVERKIKKAFCPPQARTVPLGHCPAQLFCPPCMQAGSLPACAELLTAICAIKGGRLGSAADAEMPRHLCHPRRQQHGLSAAHRMHALPLFDEGVEMLAGGGGQPLHEVCAAHHPPLERVAAHHLQEGGGPRQVRPLSFLAHVLFRDSQVC